ncbi:MAG: type II toxin-antitoxin system RelE family toxin [Pseudonocardiaceae bacterium]
MSYRIEIAAGALKTLSKLDKPVRRRLEAAIDRLAEEPRPADVVAMKSMPGHLRMRVGDYRIVYTVQDHRLVVLVVELGHRREIYR